MLALKPSAISVVYVAGMLRSGSTAFGELLGCYDRVATLGEAVFAWERSQGDYRCSCGQMTRDCAVWGDVVPAALRDTGLSLAGAVRVATAARDEMRLRRVVARSASYAQPEYALLMDRLYARAAAALGVDVVVDTSKSPGLAELQLRHSQIPMRVVHLVRDPRAVAFSESSRRAWEGVADIELPPRRRVVTSAVTWMTLNAATAFTARGSVAPASWSLLRYEDFVEASDELAVRVLADTSVASRIALRETPAEQHQIAGNPRRFSAGTFRLRRDDRWRKELSPLSRAMVAGITYPVAAPYGYVRPYGRRRRQHGMAVSEDG